MSLKKLMMAAAAVLFAAPMMASAQAQCSVEIDGNDQMKFDKSEIVISKKCKDFTVKLKNVGKLPKNAMGHNWVLAKTADVQGIATDGIAAGLDKDYLKPGDARVIATTKVIGPGETDSVTFPVSKLSDKESYTYFCSFPGHASIMKGVIKFAN